MGFSSEEGLRDECRTCVRWLLDSLEPQQGLGHSEWEGGRERGGQQTISETRN